MENLLNLLITRRSCRKCLPEMPSDEQLRQIAEAGTWAASGRGKQSPLIVMVKDRETRDHLSAMNAKIIITYLQD